MDTGDIRTLYLSLRLMCYQPDPAFTATPRAAVSLHTLTEHARSSYFIYYYYDRGAVDWVA